jgi:3-oxoacyl-[acyl-carrier protein] reductase
MNAVDAFRLDGNVAVVTGGAGGIGTAIGQALTDAGATVVLADLDLEAAEKAAAQITADKPGSATARPVDVSDPAAMNALVDAVVAEHGRLDVFVNNAAIMPRRTILEITPEEFDRVLSVNLKSVLYGGQAAARVMRPGSSIVNMLSTIIDEGTVGTGSYAAAKKGAHSLTRTFAIELGPRGIRVNGVAPGWTVTGMTRQRGLGEDGGFDQAQFDAVAERMAGKSPLGTVMETADTAHAVLYLVSPAGRHLTGQVIRVNGGASMV